MHKRFSEDSQIKSQLKNVIKDTENVTTDLVKKLTDQKHYLNVKTQILRLVWEKNVLNWMMTLKINSDIHNKIRQILRYWKDKWMMKQDCIMKSLFNETQISIIKNYRLKNENRFQNYVIWWSS